MNNYIRRFRKIGLTICSILLSIYVVYSIFIIDWLILKPTTVFYTDADKSAYGCLLSLKSDSISVIKLRRTNAYVEWSLLNVISSILICDDIDANVLVRDNKSRMDYHLRVDDCSFSIVAVSPSWDFVSRHISPISLLQCTNFYSLYEPSSTYEADRKVNESFEKLLESKSVLSTNKSTFPEREYDNNPENTLEHLYVSVYSKLPYENSPKWYSFRHWHSIIGIFIFHCEFFLLFLPIFISIANFIINKLSKQKLAR